MTSPKSVFANKEALELLERLSEVNPAAGRMYLEHLIIQNRSQVRIFLKFMTTFYLFARQDSKLHSNLALILVKDLFECAADEHTLKLWRAKGEKHCNALCGTKFAQLRRTHPKNPLG